MHPYKTTGLTFREGAVDLVEMARISLYLNTLVLRLLLPWDSDILSVFLKHAAFPH